MARMATSVSAYAVRRTRRASGASSSEAARSSIPVIVGIRWSETMRASGVSRRARRRMTSRAAVPESAARTVYSVP